MQVVQQSPFLPWTDIPPCQRCIYSMLLKEPLSQPFINAPHIMKIAFMGHECIIDSTGRPIIENITEAIYSSRKTICVISKYYLESEWCSREIQMARWE